MSIEIQDAKQKLEIMEQIAENPEIGLSKELKRVASKCDFLRQITIEGKRLCDYIKEYLETIAAFDGCIICPDARLFYIYVPSLKMDKHSSLQEDDCIMEIDLDEQTFQFKTYPIKEYECVMNASYSYEDTELSEFWKTYEDFSVKNRIKIAIKAACEKKALGVKIMDFFYILFVPRKYVDAKVNKAKESVKAKNDANKKQYDRNIAKQDFYKKYAPGQIELIKQKQKEISEFLLGFGYKELK